MEFISKHRESATKILQFLVKFNNLDIKRLPPKYVTVFKVVFTSFTSTNVKLRKLWRFDLYLTLL